MNNMVIKDRRDGRPKFEGTFETVAQCVEQAVKDNADLSFADLSFQNLAHTNLDEARLDHADFSGSNLIGANLSEAVLNNADFTNCSLESACLAYSSLKNAIFKHARFGGTIIDGAFMDGCLFSGHSGLYLDFTGTESMRNCSYEDESGNTATFSEPPILLHGLPRHVALIGRHVEIAQTLFPAHYIKDLHDPLLQRHRALLDALLSHAFPAEITRKSA